MKYIHFLLIFSLFSLSSVLFAEELTTLKKYIENYPKFDKTAATKAAEREYESKGFRLAKINEEIDITSKIGVRLKGKYYGQKDSGAIKIGKNSMQWIDVPDDKKYMFLEVYLQKKHDNFVKEYMVVQERKYNAKRKKDIYNYEIKLQEEKDRLLASNKNIMTSNGNILYNIQIKEKDEWKVHLLSNGREYTFFYKNLPPKESMKIKTGVKVVKKSGELYKDIKMIFRTPVEICFYDSHGFRQREKFRDLSVVTQKYFKYSLAEENKYLEQLKKREESQRETQILLARLKEENIKKRRKSSWIQYRNVCGNKAQMANEARAKENFNKKYKGKSIVWSGVIVSIDNDGWDRMEAYSELIVCVKMSPSDSVFIDLNLRFPKKFKSKLLKLNKGDNITFWGEIYSMGGTFLPHVILVNKFITEK